MKYTIEFSLHAADYMAMRIYEAFGASETCFKNKDLPRNIRNTCYFQELLRKLTACGADVDSTGIYNDNGYDRIGYARINEHEIVKKGQFYHNELWAALRELVEGINAE